MKKFLILLFVIFCLCGCSGDSGVESGIISYDDAKELVDSGAVLVDVRSEEEYDAGHIEGAILMPVDSIDEGNVKEEIVSKDTPVIVYCMSGARSSSAYEMLVDLGYTNVYDLGSIENWKE